DHMVFLANGWSTNVSILDIRDPNQPTQVAQIPIPEGRAFDVALLDHYAVIAQRNQGLGIIDVKDPANPVRVRDFKLPGIFANSVMVRDRRAYVGNENAGVVIVDLTEPTQPVLLGMEQTPRKANGMDLRGNVAFVANWDLGLSMVDVSNPAAPHEIGGYPANRMDYNGTAFDVLTHGNFAYVADTRSGMRVFDVENPGDIRRLTSIPGLLWDLSLAGFHLFAASGDSFGSQGELVVIDVSQPSTPVRIGITSYWGKLIGVQAYGNWVLGGGRTFGIFKMLLPSAPPAITHHPQGRIVVENQPFVLEAAAAGTEPFAFRWFQNGAEIPDVTGSVLRVTAAKPQHAGNYRVVVSNSFGTTESEQANITVAGIELRILADTIQASQGRLKFRARVNPGVRCAVLISEDGLTWREWRVMTAMTNEIEVNDESLLVAHRFYRLESR
ncbi:MAG: immunoglobulin domain-containing protein, partial [Verrucomicrobiota bacterium]